MQKFVSQPLARRLLGVNTVKLKELTEQGILRAHGNNARIFYSVADISQLLGHEIGEQDIAWAEERQAGRLASARAYAQRQADIRKGIATPRRRPLAAAEWNQPTPLGTLADALARAGRADP